MVEVPLVLHDVDQASPGQEEADHLGEELGQPDGGGFLEQSHIDLRGPG